MLRLCEKKVSQTRGSVFIREEKSLFKVMGVEKPAILGVTTGETAPPFDVLSLDFSIQLFICSCSGFFRFLLFSWCTETKLEFMLFYTANGSAPEITDRSCQWDLRAWWDVCLMCMPKEGVAPPKKASLFLNASLFSAERPSCFFRLKF